MVYTIVLFTAVVNVGIFFFVLAGNQYVNQVVLWRSLENVVIEKKENMVHTIVLFMAVVNVSKFLFFFLAGNPYFNQAVFWRSLG